ncbi:SDR family NAD(P)-dependent oxidoreductase [Pelagibacterium sp. 26DY04]|uniref:NAD-dependent epimerase/dehydratase family protein n=1 Tax=Pelagibacterium sp. 26DY04 TaxID=2967130 RepID=UPI0028151810|nr:SDR family NAD(P)-dependent oxidoreductase [Pelagibacterium sp. 26DY04]WMT86137.1 SDR family NAD(P)-dependent oxidoreductase [Pelagibacterium sp. 26DY04]
MDKVLITGGCGFIGRALTAELLDAGYDVRVFDSLVEQVHEAGAPELPAQVEVQTGDMRDAAAVKKALDGVNGVFHLAAEVGVGQSMYEITRYVGANELGTAVLLEAMIDRPIRRIVVASSMSIYGEGRYVDASGAPHDHIRRKARDIAAGQWELHDAQGQPLRPVATDEEKQPDLASIYALNKYAQERASLIFGDTYETDAVALRLFNVFGPGQALSNPYTGVLANFASRIASGERPTIFEDGQQQRDFVHVRDVARAFRLAFEKPEAAGHAINIGSGQAYSIERVARILAEAMGKPDLSPEIMRKARAGDIRNCFADISKARELLGYQPRYRLEDTVGELADWVAKQTVIDRGAEMRRHLEQRGLVK